MTEQSVFVPVVGEPQPEFADDWEQKRMTLIEHLEELRRRLIVSLVAYALGSVVGVALSGYAIALVVKPLGYLHQPLHYFGPMDYFIIHFKVGAALGLVLALPVIFHQSWAFVAPGLKPAERRLAGPLLLSAVILFALGAGLSYFFLYIAIRVIGWVSHDQSLVFFPEANLYIGFVAVLMLVFGIAFEFPVALVLGALLGVVRSTWLRQKRKLMYFVIIVVGYVVTPGVDPITPLALILPMVLLFEGSILVIRRLGK